MTNILQAATVSILMHWNNPQVLDSNVVSVTPIAGGPTSYFVIPKTNQSVITAPSNTQRVAVMAAIGTNWSDPSNYVTNRIEVGVPVTNGFTYWVESTTDLSVPFASNSLIPSVRVTNGQGPSTLYFRGKIQPW